jgi:mRNA-degrading endonuclease toxin of MazEF toxin-antitoxin module
VNRGEIWLVALDPTIGSEIQKTRPCTVILPSELNRHLRTGIVASMTTGNKPALPRSRDLRRQTRTDSARSDPNAGSAPPDEALRSHRRQNADRTAERAAYEVAPPKQLRLRERRCGLGLSELVELSAYRLEVSKRPLKAVSTGSRRLW